MSGLGDLYTRMEERLNPRDDVFFSDWGKFQSSIIREPDPVIKPEELDKIIIQARALENVLAGTLILNKRPAYLDAPYRSDPVEMYKNTDLALPAGSANVNVLSLTVQPGVTMVINEFANECENLAAHGDVRWSFQIDGQNINIQTVWFDGAGQDSSYQDFQPSLGSMPFPGSMGRPFSFTGPGVFALVARNPSLINHRVSARMKGWIYTPGRVSLDRESPSQVMT